MLVVVVPQCHQHRKDAAEPVLLPVERTGLATSLQALRPILSKQQAVYLPGLGIAQRRIQFAQSGNGIYPRLQRLAVVAPPELDKLGECPVICRALYPLFVVFSGYHPALELLGLGLGLEALADPLAFPPLRTDID